MEHKIKKMVSYIQETLGVLAIASPIAKSDLDSLPMYIDGTYKLYRTKLFNTDIILAELINEEGLRIQQIEKQVQQIKKLLKQQVVVVAENVQAYHRKRLIEKRISFIVPGKQLYLPDLLTDLRERYAHPKLKQTKATLLPSAQFLLIYHIIHRNDTWKLEEHPFKGIAKKLAYTPMSITNAIDNLKYHELVDVRGGKEKFIRFRYDIPELWNIVCTQNLLVNPVIKTVFVDEKPKDLFLLKSNTSALPEYTDLSEGKQQYYAIGKRMFYGLQKSKVLINPNEHEGSVALEIWKYDPLPLIDCLSKTPPVVDPLSLYLSVKDSGDERVEMALEQILQEFIW